MWKLLSVVGLLFSIGMTIADDGVAKDFEFGAQFIRTMKKIIDSKNPEIIGTLFNPEFVIVGCNGTYPKEKLIQYLVMIKQTPGFTLKEARSSGATIDLVYAVTRPSTPTITVNLVFNKTEQKLQSAHITSCKKSFVETNEFIADQLINEEGQAPAHLNINRPGQTHL